MLSIKKFFSDYGIGAIIVLLIVAYGVSLFANYLSSKGSSKGESMEQKRNSAYNNAAPVDSVQPSEPLGQNEVYASASGIQTTTQGASSGCGKQQPIQDPAQLLPSDANSQWAQLNPSGKGELANVNLLKAGYHVGIDTIGQTLRNANLQLRSEPPNPQVYTGPFNQSTISPDFMRPSFEIGSGSV